MVLAAVIAIRSQLVSTASAHTHRRSDDPVADASVLLAGTTRGAVARGAVLPPPAPGQHWLASWGAGPQEAAGNQVAVRGFRDQTLREIVFASTGGTRVRVHFTNLYGSRPLVIGNASVAPADRGAGLASGSIRPLTFGGHHWASVPPGAEVVSDPVMLRVAPGSELAISIYLPEATGAATEHTQARQLSFVAAGNAALSPAANRFRGRTTSWYFIDGVDLLSSRRDIGAVVTLGDSITDGVGSPAGANARWPNDLARRLDALRGPTLSVIDEGIGGNRVLNDSACCGVDAVARFENDVAQRTGVRDVILLEGINDIGYSLKRGALTAPHTDVSALQIIDGYEQIIALAHADGLRIFGATLTPFQGARYWSPAGEAKREAVNDWILTSGAFDGVIDFAHVLADPSDPERLNPAYDSGDHLHPNAAGYCAMANAVSLAALLRSH